MRTRARAFSLMIKDYDTLRSPHGPCPPRTCRPDSVPDYAMALTLGVPHGSGIARRASCLRRQLLAGGRLASARVDMSGEAESSAQSHVRRSLLTDLGHGSTLPPASNATRPDFPCHG